MSDFILGCTWCGGEVSESFCPSCALCGAPYCSEEHKEEDLWYHEPNCLGSFSGFGADEYVDGEPKDEPEDEPEDDDGLHHDHQAGDHESDSRSLYERDVQDNVSDGNISEATSPPSNSLSESLPCQSTDTKQATFSDLEPATAILEMGQANKECTACEDMQKVLKVQASQIPKHAASQRRRDKSYEKYRAVIFSRNRGAIDKVRPRMKHREMRFKRVCRENVRYKTSHLLMSKSGLKECQSLEKKNSTLKSEKETLEREKGLILAEAQRLKNIESKSQSFQQQSDARAARIVELVAEVQTLQASEANALLNYNTSATIVTQLEAQVQNLQTSEANAVSKYKVSAAKATQLEHDLKAEKDSFETRKGQALEDAERELKSARETIKKLREQEKENESQTKAALEGQMNALALDEEGRFTQIRKENDTALNAVHDQKEKLEKNISKLQIKYDEAKDKNDAKTEELRLIYEERNQLSKSLAASRKDVTTKQKRIDELKATNELLQALPPQAPISTLSTTVGESPEVKALKAAVEASQEKAVKMQRKFRTLEQAYREATKNRSCLSRLRAEIQLGISNDNLRELVHTDSVAPAQALPAVEYTSSHTQTSDTVEKLLGEPFLRLPRLSRPSIHVENVIPTITVIHKGDDLAAAAPGVQNQVVEEAAADDHTPENPAPEEPVQQSLMHDTPVILNRNLQDVILKGEEFARKLRALPKGRARNNVPAPALRVAAPYLSFSNFVIIGYVVYLYFLFLNYGHGHINTRLPHAPIEKIEAPIVDVLPPPSPCIVSDDLFATPIASYGPIYKTTAPIFNSTSLRTEFQSDTILDNEEEPSQSTPATTISFDIVAEPEEGIVQRFVDSIYGETPFNDIWWFISTAIGRSLYAAFHGGRCYPPDHYYYDVWYEDFVSSCMNYGVLRWIADAIRG